MAGIFFNSKTFLRFLLGVPHIFCWGNNPNGTQTTLLWLGYVRFCFLFHWSFHFSLRNFLLWLFSLFIISSLSFFVSWQNWAYSVYICKSSFRIWIFVPLFGSFHKKIMESGRFWLLEDSLLFSVVMLSKFLVKL